MKKDLRVEMSLTISVAEILMGFHCVLKSLCNIRMLPAGHTLRGTFFFAHSFRFPPVCGGPDAGVWMVLEGHH